MSTFVFFHVGPDLAMPARMVESLRRHNPTAEIVQVTDHDTRTVPGVTWTAPTDGDREYLMLWRTQAFAGLGLTDPAMYMDTDMIVNKPINVELLLDDHHIAACRRSFNRDAMFNIHQRGQDYSEYSGKTLDEVYPILGCCTITASSGAWEAMAESYAALPPKFKRWYGDQEVLRDYVNSLPASWVTYLPESEFACLPEASNVYPRPSITHYKGQRKALLNGVAPA